MMNKLFRRIRWGCLALIAIVVLGVGGIFLAVNQSPAFAAQGADVLRGIFGDKFVARLEMLVFQVQDRTKKWEYGLGLKKPAVP
jgi:hypothetical protein